MKKKNIQSSKKINSKPSAKKVARMKSFLASIKLSTEESKQVEEFQHELMKRRKSLCVNG